MSFSASEIADALRQQAAYCKGLGSPLNAGLLEVLAEEAVPGAEWLHDLETIEGGLMEGAISIRVMGAFHRRVLDFPEIPLAGYYASVGGRFESDYDAARFEESVRSLLSEHAAFLPQFIRHPPQTNEVARAAGLVAGLLEVARLFGRPFRLLEIGASGGLNQAFDQYGYRFETPSRVATWGSLESSVQLAPGWQGGTPVVSAPLEVSERGACDIAPLDIRDEAVRRRLEAYIWGDQLERLNRLRGAMEIGRHLDVLPDSAGAAEWLAEKLPARSEAEPCVVFHSIMWQYMSANDQAEIARMIESAGRKTQTGNPLAWLRIEPPSPVELPEVRLRIWPGGEERLVGHAHPHGLSYRWQGWGG